MFKTTWQLVAALQDREVSAADLAEQSIARIQARDGEVNAVVVRDFARAREAAASADAALARGVRLPLLGVPITVKEAINVAGLPTTWGIPGTQAIDVWEDALAVQRLKAAGAIVLGKTNVPVQLADWQTYNAIYGVTRNPWNLALTPGGSSGGSAAALAAGFVSLELGTDLAGSLRVPAHCCGVFAHKPTHDLVPMHGIAPPGTPMQANRPRVDFAVVGPMARCAQDLSLALDVLAGPDPVQSTGYRLALPPARHAALADFRVLVLDTSSLAPTSQEVRATLHRFADRLARSGCRMASSSPLLPDLALVAETFTPLVMSFFSADMPPADYQGLQRAAAGLSPDDRSAAAMQLRGMVLSHRDWVHADRVRAALCDQWRRLFGDWDVVLCPVLATPAFAHDHAEMNDRRIRMDGADISYAEQAFWPTLASCAGLPATAMPVGLGESGLPIGVQIIGPYLEDRTPLAFATLAEREFGGFVAPPAFAS
jgi:amidase